MVISKLLNNQEYRYKIYEKSGSADWGVFLLGALQGIDSVDYFSRHFSNTVNTIVIETPGTPGNGVLEATVTVRDQAQMIVDLLDDLKITKAHLFGFSYATAVSVELCDIWSGVLSLSIGCGVPGIPKSGRLSTYQFIAAAMSGDKKHFASVFADLLLSDSPNIPRSKVIRRSIVSNVMKFDDEKIMAFVENSTRLLAHKPSNLEAITMPCLVLAGESDPYATAEITKEFHSKLKHAHYVSIKNSDHMLHLEQPEKTADALITLAKNHIATISKFKLLES